MSIGRKLLVSLLLVCSACASQLDIGPNDASIGLFEVDGKTGVPGATSVEADGCMLVIRNLELLNEADQSLESINMQTATCSFGKAGEQ